MRRHVASAEIKGKMMDLQDRMAVCLLLLVDVALWNDNSEVRSGRYMPDTQRAPSYF
jgi:hypothetical protein